MVVGNPCVADFPFLYPHLGVYGLGTGWYHRCLEWMELSVRVLPSLLPSKAPSMKAGQFTPLPTDLIPSYEEKMEEIRKSLSERADRTKKAKYPGQAEWLKKFSHKERGQWFDLLFKVEALEEEDRALWRSFFDNSWAMNPVSEYRAHLNTRVC